MYLKFNQGNKIVSKTKQNKKTKKLNLMRFKIALPSLKMSWINIFKHFQAISAKAFMTGVLVEVKGNRPEICYLSREHLFGASAPQIVLGKPGIELCNHIIVTVPLQW